MTTKEITATRTAVASVLRENGLSDVTFTARTKGDRHYVQTHNWPKAQLGERAPVIAKAVIAGIKARAGTRVIVDLQVN